MNEFEKEIIQSAMKDVETLKDMMEKKMTGEKVELPIRLPREKNHSLNMILYGAPGTGKTYSTAEYAMAIIEDRDVRKNYTAEERAELMKSYKQCVKDGRIVFTTFHQNYGYEDFIQGLRPDNAGGSMVFKPIDGVFKKIADKAMSDDDNAYVIIIDEINSANISKVFGELITLIEDDKRWGEANEISVTLPYGGEFAVPNNLYIIGTMNSADKSISLIDTALRRRFEFVEVAPDESLVANDTLRTVLHKLNAGLRKELESTDLLIGHSYFIGKDEIELCKIMNRNIIPLLYEYYYDDSKKVRNQVVEVLDGLDYEVEDTVVSRINVKEKS